MKSKISFFRLADISVITGTLALGIAKVGFSIFGKPMVNIMPWGVNIYGKVMHPVQLYEAILYYALFIFLWRKIEKQKYAGEVFSIYLILFPIIRGIVEFFKISPMPIISFSVNNFLNLIFIVTGIIINVYIGSKHKMAEIKEKNNKTNMGNQLPIFITLVATSVIIFYWVQG